MAKRKGSLYVNGRSTQWLKLRISRRQDCAVIGWLPMSGAAESMGALALAVVEDGRLVYAGRVGTGFDDRTRRALAERLERDCIDAPSADKVPKTREAHWVTPKLVCDCAFTEWTSDGSMRHPRFIGLREDKAADGLRPRRRHRARARRPRPRRRRRSRPVPKLANPAKVLFPRDGITKQDIWDYYTAIAPVMLPHIAGRPLTMQRYPDGIDGEEWYQQNAPVKTPEFVRLIDSGQRHEHKQRIVCDTLDTLQWLANLAALTLHQWCSHVPPGTRHPGRPRARARAARLRGARPRSRRRPVVAPGRGCARHAHRCSTP